MIDTEALQSSEAPSPRTSMGIDNINIAEHISNDLSVAELQNTSENKVKKSSRKNKKKTSKKSSSTSKSKKSSKSKKTQKKIKDNNGESDASSNNSETSDDDSSESSESSSDSSSDETSSSSSSSSDSSSSSSNSSSGKKKSSKKNKFSIQKHPLYIRSFDDVNGTFIDHRPSMTEPVLKNKKKSMMKKRRERKKKAKAERQKEIAKQSEETNPSSNHTNKGKNGNGGLETVHEEPESNGDKANRNKLIADLQVHLTEGFEKHNENDQATNQDSQSKYGSINNKNAENKAKDKYRGRNHFSMGYPPERTNSIDQQMDTSFDELRLAKKKSNDSNNNDIGNLGSKPPSSNSNSSDASSLGDVCLPITSDSEYYISDINSDEENNESIGSSKSRHSKRSQSDGDSDNKSTINSKGFDGSRYEKEIMNNIFDLNKLKNKFDKKNNEDEIHNLQSSKTNTTTSSLRNKNKRRKKTSVKKEWPDISVLEEFSKDETYKLKKQALDNNRNIRNMMSPDLCYDNIHARGLNNQSPVVMNAGFGLTNQASQPQEDTESNASSSVAGFQQTIGFKNPLVSNVDVPELGNAKINETELLKNKNIKNSRFQAWKLTNKAQKKLLSAGGAMVDRSAAATNTIFGTDIPKLSKTASNSTANITKHNTDINENTNFLIGDSSVIQYPPQIISNNPEHFRFAYFRDDMESTVHSPTISGLLQPGQSFRDLFVGEHYKKNVDYDESDFDSEGNLKFDEDNNYTAPFWLDVLNPTEEEMKVISKSFGIHPLTAEDIFQGEAREKVELFKDYYLVCFRSFDIVAERHSRDNRSEKSGKSRRSSFSTVSSDESAGKKGSKSHGVVENLKNKVFKFIGKNNSSKNNHPTSAMSVKSSSRGTNNDARSSYMSKQQKEKELDEYKKKSGSRHKPRSGELEPLNVYILVFRTGVLTFHFAPTPHPINVRRRARLIRDYMDVSSDWVAYALIDDITDSFAPIIEIIEDEVYDIEEEILKMHNPDAYDSDDDSDSDSDYSDFESSYDEKMKLKSGNSSKKTRSMSTVDDPSFNKDTNNVTFGNRFNNGHSDLSSMSDTSSMTGYSRGTSSTSSSDSTSIDSNIILWKRKGDMLRRIAECRKRVMSVSRLLGSKADVIKSFAKRCNEDWEVAPRSDIGMYLGDIQDHIVTMVSSLNHFEKLLSRSHSNYLAQINIDMTKVNNDMNDVLGKITILGTAVLPLNVITGLWGMNCIVPGQKYDNLGWFFGIVGFMIIFTAWSVWYTKKKLSF